MLVRDLKKKLDELGMEWKEMWEPAPFTHNLTKTVEVFFTEDQMIDVFDDEPDEYGDHLEAISIVCTTGWKEVEELLTDLRIL